MVDGIGIEQSLLAALMLEPSGLAKVADWLDESDFTSGAHRAIYRAIGELSRRDGEVDPVTLTDWFEASALTDVLPDSGYLLTIAANSAGSPTNVVAYAELVAERSKLRQIQDFIAELSATASEPGATSSRIIADAVQRLSRMTPARRGGLEPVKGGLQVLFRQMAERYEHPNDGMIGMPTPWHDINELTHGLRDGALYVIGARPSMGKSILSGQLATFAALRKLRVAWFSVEMTKAECLSRSVSMISDVDHEWIEAPNPKDPDQDTKWGRVTQANAALIESPLLIDDTPDVTIEQLMARARRAHMQEPLRLVVIDHMHDMRIDPRQARFDYGRIAQGAKTLAKEFGCPVVLVAQLNRGLSNRADKRPTLTDLRESGEIEQKADVVLFVHRPDYYDPADQPGVVEIIPAKGRGLKIGGHIYLRNEYHRMRMVDWEGPLPGRDDRITSAHQYRFRRSA